MKAVVSMNEQGRLTVPVAAREALHLEGATQFELAVEGDAIILRPALVIPREDAWAYTDEHLQRVRQAQAQVQGAETRRLGEDELNDLLPDAP